MFYKAIMTTLTVSIISSSLLAPSQALAESVTSTVQRDANGTADHRSTDTVWDHRTQRENEVVPVTGHKKDCRVGATKLFKMGYRSIYAVDCSGTTYHYVATDNAALFAAEMNAFSGEIDVTFIGITG